MSNTIYEMDFYYENESEQFVFYRIPKLLFTDARFSRISTDAKLLYALFLDRMSLSRKKGWVDDDKRVYIYFSVKEIMARFNIASEKCTKIISELDDVKGCGLIHKKRQGQGKPTKIYVMKFTSRSESKKYPKPVTFENQNSEISGTEKQDFRNMKCNNKDTNYNEFSDIYPITTKRNATDEITERGQYQEIIKENIDYDVLVANNECDDINEIVEIMLDAVCSKKEYLIINCSVFPQETVKNRMLKLDMRHIDYVLECLNKNTSHIRNIKSYILTSLYNSYATINQYYKAEVNHNLYNM